MIASTTEDWHLHALLQSKLREEIITAKPLKNLRDCCTASMPQGVSFYKSDADKVHVDGVIHCHSNACPVCASYKMMIYQQYITDAFTMKNELNQSAFMLTVTVPHWRFNKDTGEFLKLKDVITLLKMCLSKFQTGGSWKKCKKELSIGESFYVMETTHNKYKGWHPHYHILFWLPKDNLQKLKDWEDKLSGLWQKYVIKFAKQIYKIDNYGDRLTYKGGLNIAKTKSGEIGAMSAANYFWSAPSEMTGLRFKQGRKNSRTIWQLLNDALLKNDNEAWQLWKEYALEIAKLQPYRLSRNFKRKIDNWRTQNPTKTFIERKKNTQQKPMEFICWLPQSEWQLLNSKSDHIANISKIIVQFADIELMRKFLAKYFQSYGVRCTFQLPFQLKQVA